MAEKRKSVPSKPRNWWAVRVGVIIALVALITGAAYLRQQRLGASPEETVTVSAPAGEDTDEGRSVESPPVIDEPTPNTVQGTTTESTPNPALPRLLDLGAGKCIPCKMMEPILEELREDYADRFEVVFIDVWEDREAGKPYGVRVIPTQIFFDASGNELYRHVGFFSKEAILEKWEELGIDLGEGGEDENKG